MDILDYKNIPINYKNKLVIPHPRMHKRAFVLLPLKELSAKLLEWTNKRWIIAFSKEEGLPTVKKQKKDLEVKLIKKESETDFSKEIKKLFPDSQLVKVEEENKS